MDKVRNKLTGKQYELPDKLIFDMASSLTLIKLLISTRNNGDVPGNVIELGAAFELLLKEVAGSQTDIHLHDADIYGVTSQDLETKIQIEVVDKFRDLYPFVSFFHLNLAYLEGTMAEYDLVTVEIDDNEYEYI